MQEVDRMWHQDYESGWQNSNNTLSQGIFGQVVPSKMVPHTWNDKFSHSMVTLKEIAGLMAECGQQEYSERHLVLQKLFGLWAAGKQAVVLEVLLNGNGKKLMVLVFGFLHMVHLFAPTDFFFLISSTS